MSGKYVCPQDSRNQQDSSPWDYISESAACEHARTSKVHLREIAGVREDVDVEESDLYRYDRETGYWYLRRLVEGIGGKPYKGPNHKWFPRLAKR